MKKKRLLISLSIIVAIAFFIFPIPYFIERPGTAQPTQDAITIKQHDNLRPGKLLFTTVSLMPATSFTALLSQLQPFNDVVSRKEILANENDAEYMRLQKYLMENSGNDAVMAAFAQAHKSAIKEYRGIYVMSILPKSAFKSKIAVGDTISKIDRHCFHNSQSFINYIKTKKVNDKVQITYQHHGKTLTAKQKLISLNKRHKPGIGITLVDHFTVHSKPTVKIDAGEVGGPSAGLMFSLQIYEQIAQKDLTKGRIVAGTGTIDDQGKVGPIGGIDKKVVAADKQGANIFFAPQDDIKVKSKRHITSEPSNYAVAKQTAKKIKTKMKIIPVKNLPAAINYLEAH
ncbi:SepM family pheromone-processing serine protease [Bombilactobacillus thymidiniphilus]|uniref:endopeptidase La n=1 Tax=Bombilactobacillus thymidiniphilus TaxID=2923363 RepID=A0ABY4PEN6_9LACO|nr:SepM family pheromone-processing serine protease [Bombilactobacillus thymidiniphilus]UQS83757.1 PDZ domain-containing protein [Bombilactobacillus thymidiniphilus]